ncbi:MAG: VanZ family protein [Candidatus Eisenbacteria bacterium]|nr:VanZ family protein [Candidatus Eisenbacteria bacterium]MBU1950805.1 VanZ family protein [Candidatus Eisenbacteria bacterium]
MFIVSSRSDVSMPVGFPHADKIAHLIEYSILGWLVAGVLDYKESWRRWKLYLIVIGAVLLFGCLDELNQSRVPGRDSSLYDLMADLAGAIVGSLLWRWTRQFERKKEKGRCPNPQHQRQQ